MIVNSKINENPEQFWEWSTLQKDVRIRSYSSPYFFRIFPHWDWIRGDKEYLSAFYPNAGKYRKNLDQNNSEYGHFLRSDQKSSSWFHSLLSCCIYCMRKYPIHVTWAQGETPNTLCITWGSKLKTLYDKLFATATRHKNVQNYHNEKCTYNVKTQSNSLYALNI